MNRHTPPRRRPQTQGPITEIPMSLQDGLPGSAALDQAAADEASGSDTHRISPDAAARSDDWRDRLAKLKDAGALTTAQEADCFRLFETHEADIRDSLPPLLSELKPHFGTPSEAEAKAKFTESLKAIKRKQHEEVARLLASFGLEGDAPPLPE